MKCVLYGVDDDVGCDDGASGAVGGFMSAIISCRLAGRSLRDRSRARSTLSLKGVSRARFLVVNFW